METTYEFEHEALPFGADPEEGFEFKAFLTPDSDEEDFLVVEVYAKNLIDGDVTVIRNLAPMSKRQLEKADDRTRHNYEIMQQFDNYLREPDRWERIAEEMELRGDGYDGGAWDWSTSRGC